VAAVATSPATLARAHVLELLAAAGIAATGDVGAFYPQPAGVLVELPTLIGRTLAATTFELPIQVVSGDPYSAGEHVIDRLLALADDVAAAVRSITYRPTTWSSSSNAEPLPAVEVTVTVTVST
jgi:hypothetical protein